MYASFNGIQLIDVSSPIDNQVHVFNGYNRCSSTGTGSIRFEARGISNSIGMTIDNIRIARMIPV